MIKVNLLKSKAVIGEVDLGSQSEEIESISLGSEFETTEHSVVSQLLKIVLMFSFLIGLFVLERKRGNEGVDLVNQKRDELEGLFLINEEKAGELANFDKVMLRLKNIKKQDAEVSEIKSNRLNLIASLDMLQTAARNDLWFTSVDYTGGAISIEGKALIKRSLDEFVERLRAESIFSNVIVIRDSEGEVIRGGKVLDFKVSVSLVSGVKNSNNTGGGA